MMLGCELLVVRWGQHVCTRGRRADGMGPDASVGDGPQINCGTWGRRCPTPHAAPQGGTSRRTNQGGPRLSLAPMEGITGHVFRRAHARCLGACRAPTRRSSRRPGWEGFRPTGPRRARGPGRERRRGGPAAAHRRRRDEFVWAAGLLARMGYREVNLNLGCPWRTIVSGARRGLPGPPRSGSSVSSRCVRALRRCPVSVKAPGDGRRRRVRPAARRLLPCPWPSSWCTRASGRTSTPGAPREAYGRTRGGCSTGCA